MKPYRPKRPKHSGAIARFVRVELHPGDHHHKPKSRFQNTIQIIELALIDIDAVHTFARAKEYRVAHPYLCKQEVQVQAREHRIDSLATRERH